MPKERVAKALILSTFSSSVFWLFHSFMVLSVFSPGTVQRVFTAPYPFVAVRFAFFTFKSLVDIIDAIGDWTTEGIGPSIWQGSQPYCHAWVDEEAK